MERNCWYIVADFYVSLKINSILRLDCSVFERVPGRRIRAHTRVSLVNYHYHISKKTIRLVNYLEMKLPLHVRHLVLNLIFYERDYNCQSGKRN